jgi:hypothetical protein
LGEQARRIAAAARQKVGLLFFLGVVFSAHGVRHRSIP